MTIRAARVRLVPPGNRRRSPFHAAWRAMTGTGGANDSAERRRSLTVEIPHLQTKQEYQI